MRIPEKRRAAILLGCVIALLLGCIVWACLVLRRPHGQLVEIVQDGQVIETIDLAASPDQEIRIDWPQGSYNTVRIENGTIRVADAGCPDHTCMKTGVLRSESLPIVCLPNRLVIRYVQE